MGEHTTKKETYKRVKKREKSKVECGPEVDWNRSRTKKKEKGEGCGKTKQGGKKSDGGGEGL